MTRPLTRLSWLATIAGCCTVACAQNLVPHPGFEQPAGWATPSYHYPERVTRDAGTAVEGKWSLKLDGSGGELFVDSHCQSRLSLRPGATYAVQVAIRRTSRKGTVTLAVLEKGEQPGWRHQHYFGSTGSRGTDRWEVFRGTFTVPADSAQTALILYNITSGGVAWFDDISIVEIDGTADPFSLRCRRVTAPPVLDGQLTEWEGADRAVDFMVAGQEALCPLRSPFQAEVSMAYDDKQLYLAAAVHEPAGYARKTTAQGLDSPVWADDELEVFLAPMAGTNEFYQFAINSSGALYDAHQSPDRPGAGDPSWNSGATVKRGPRPDGWGLELSIPLASLGGIGAAGGRFVANFCRNLAAAGQLASWARLEPGDGFQTTGNFQPVLATASVAGAPRTVSLHSLLRGQGFLTNADLSPADDGPPQFWSRTGDTLSQELQTGPYSAGARFTLLVSHPAPGNGAAELSYRTTAGKTVTQRAEVSGASPWLRTATFTLAEGAASLTRLGLQCPAQSRPVALQLDSNRQRTFHVLQRQLTEFLIKGNTNVLPKDQAGTYLLYPELSLIRNQPSPASFNSIQTFGETTGTTLAFRGKDRGYKLVLDLPAGVELYSTGLFSRFFARDPQGPQPSPQGEGYRQFVVPLPRLSPCNQACLYLTTALPAGAAPPVYYHLEWEGGRQPVEQVAVHVYDKPTVTPPTRFTAGVYYWIWDQDNNASSGTIFRDPQAQAFLTGLHQMGLNTFVLNSLWGRNVCNLPELDKLVPIIKQAGFTMAQHTSGMGDQRALAAKDGALAVCLDGKQDAGVCLSYRGAGYQAAVTAWATLAKHGIYWIDNDYEDFNYREDQVCFCPRCKDGFRAWLAQNHPQLAYADPQEFEKRPGDFTDLHRAWWEYKNGLLVSWHADVREQMGKLMEAAGVKLPGFPRIGITESLTQWDWKRLTAGPVDYISPMIYAYILGYGEPAVESAGRSMRSYLERSGVDRKKYIVTIAPAERTGEVVWPDKSMMYQVLEVAGAGAAGFKIWYEEVMSAGQYWWMSRALRMIQPVEDILLDGRFARVPCENPNARVHAFRHPTGTVLFAAEYSPDKTELELAEAVTVPSVVMDLDTGQELAALTPQASRLKLTLDEDRVKLLFVGTREQWQQVTARRDRTAGTEQDTQDRAG